MKSAAMRVVESQRSMGMAYTARPELCCKSSSAWFLVSWMEFSPEEKASPENMIEGELGGNDVKLKTKDEVAMGRRGKMKNM